MKNRVLVLLFLVSGLVSCEKEEVKENDFKGFYKIVNIDSNIQADLNNDGIVSNVFEEISGVHIINNQSISNFYDFESYSSYAEVRPTEFNEASKAKLINFNYPFQEIDYIGEGADKPFISDYSNKFNTYSYSVKNNGEIVLKDYNKEYTSQYGEIHSLERLDEDNFEIEMTTKLFDFQYKKWRPAELIVKYTRVIN